MGSFIELLIACATLSIAISCAKNKDEESNSWALAGLLILDFVVIYNLFN